MISIAFLGLTANPIWMLFPFSTYAISLKLVLQAEYWDPTVVPEDWHMFLRCSFASGTANEPPVRVVALPTIVGNDCAIGDTAWEALTASYQQFVRWFWGAEDLGYIVVKLFDVRNFSLMLFLRKLQCLFWAMEHHLLMAMAGSILMCNAVLRLVVEQSYDQSFREDMEWYFPETVSSLSNLSHFSVGALVADISLIYMLMMWLTLCMFDHLYRNKVVKDRLHFHCQSEPSVLRWLGFALNPLFDVFLFILPSLHAHAKLFFLGNLVYVTTPKKSNSSDDTIRTANKAKVYNELVDEVM